MSTAEIQLHEAQIEHSVVRVAYTLTDNGDSADVPFHQIKLDSLIEYVKENELNFVYFGINPDELTKLDAETYTRDNLTSIVQSYLEDQLS